MGNNCVMVDMELSNTLKKLQSKSEVLSKTDIDRILHGIRSSDSQTVFMCIKAMRHLLSVSTLPETSLIKRIVEKGVIPTLVSCLDASNYPDLGPELQYETTWLLLNICTGSDDQTKAIIEAGGVPKLISLLESEHQKIKEVAIWTLSNIACDGSMPRGLLFSNKIVEKVVGILTDTNSTLQTLRVTTWLCTNLCFPIGYSHPPYMCVKELVRPLINLLDKNDVKVVKSSAQALRHIIRCSTSINDALDTNLLEKLKSMFQSPHATIVSQAAFTLGAISRGTMYDNNRILENSELMATVVEVLKCNDIACLKEVAWAFFKVLSRASSVAIDDLVNTIEIFDVLRDLLVWSNEGLNNVTNLIINLLRDQSGVTYLPCEE